MLSNAIGLGEALFEQDLAQPISTGKPLSQLEKSNDLFESVGLRVLYKLWRAC